MNSRDIEALSVDVLTKYYQWDMNPFLEVLHPDAVLLFVGRNQLVEGREVVKSYFLDQTEKGIQYDLTSMTCQSYPIGKYSLCLIIQMDIVTYYPDGEIRTVNQRMMVNWVHCNKVEIDGEMHFDKWMIKQMHVSLGMETEGSQVNIAHISESYLNETIEQVKKEKKFSIKDVDGCIHYIQENQIVRIQGQGVYICIYLNDREITAHKTLSEMEESLTGSFVRIHKSHIVNAWQVDSVKNCQAILKDGEVLPISRKEYSLVKKKLVEMTDKNEE